MREVDHYKAGGVVLRQTDGVLEVLIIHRPRVGAGDFALPKGHIEEGESAEIAAVREVKEETGYDTKVLHQLGVDEYTYKFDNDPHTPHRGYVTFFLMEVTSEIPDAITAIEEVDEAIWVTTEKAFQVIPYEGQKEMVRKAIAAISKK